MIQLTVISCPVCVEIRCNNASGKRIIIASEEGAKAAMAARQYLLDLRKRSNDHG